MLSLPTTQRAPPSLPPSIDCPQVLVGHLLTLPGIHHVVICQASPPPGLLPLTRLPSRVAVAHRALWAQSPHSMWRQEQSFQNRHPIGSLPCSHPFCGVHPREMNTNVHKRPVEVCPQQHNSVAEETQRGPPIPALPPSHEKKCRYSLEWMNLENTMLSVGSYRGSQGLTLSGHPTPTPQTRQPHTPCPRCDQQHRSMV